ncbi:MAG: TIGR02710 family CRISPR-associated CARF protein [bacterium]
MDLLAHADRRAAEHRYDVAVALLYRLLEYLAQLGLHRRGLRSDGVQVDRLPEAVRAKWKNRVDNEGRLKVGLVHGFELLGDLGDPVGRRFAELYRADRSPLKPYLETRNRSPLAHGFQPVGPEAFEKLREVVAGSFLREFVADWEARLREH